MTADLGADERRIRHILRARGVGPDAITAPAPAGELPFGLFELPDVLDAPPATEAVVEDQEQAVEDQEQAEETRPGRRSWPQLSKWTKAAADEEPAADEEQDEDQAPDTSPEPDLQQDQEQDGTEQPADQTDKTAPRAPRASLADVVHDIPPRARWALFNGSAAGAGYLTGLTSYFARYLPDAEQAATGFVALGLAGGAAWAAWRIFGHRAAAQVLPAPAISRALLTVVAAELARRTAPLGVPFLADLTATVGLDREQTALLVTVAAMSGLLLAIDRQFHRWRLACRWLARIPLASALLATALYAPGH